MQVTLTISESPSLPAHVLRLFISKSRERGKTPEQRLCELINEEAALQGKLRRKLVRKGGV